MSSVYDIVTDRLEGLVDFIEERIWGLEAEG